MNSVYILGGPFVLLVLAVIWLILRRKGTVIIRRRNERIGVAREITTHARTDRRHGQLLA